MDEKLFGNWYTVAQEKMVTLAESDDVIAAALSNPKVLAAAKSQMPAAADPVAWLQDRLNVVFPHETEILCFRLKGSQKTSARDRLLLQAVLNAFVEHVNKLDREEGRLFIRHWKAKYDALMEQIELRSSSLRRLEQVAGEDSPAVKLRQQELASLVRKSDELARRIKVAESDIQPLSSRIQVVQQPTTVF